MVARTDIINRLHLHGSMQLQFKVLTFIYAVALRSCEKEVVQQIYERTDVSVVSVLKTATIFFLQILILIIVLNCKLNLLRSYVRQNSLCKTKPCLSEIGKNVSSVNTFTYNG